MKLTIVLLLSQLTFVTALKYTGDIPHVPVQFSGASDAEEFDVAVFTSSSGTFFWGKGCEGCNNPKHSKLVDQDKYSMTLLNDFAATDDSILNGQQFQGYVKVLGVEAKTAVIRLVQSLGKDKTQVIKQFPFDGELDLNGLPDWSALLLDGTTNKFLIVRRGPYSQTLKDKELKNTHGFISVSNEDKMDGCGSFQYFTLNGDQTKGTKWLLEATIKIAGQDYGKQVIGFAAHKQTAVPQAVFSKHFSDNSENVPAFSVTFKEGDQQLAITPDAQDFLNYPNGDDTLAQKVGIQEAKTGEASYLIGREFLQSYCVSFKVDGKKKTIGLAPISKLDDDPEFVIRSSTSPATSDTSTDPTVTTTIEPQSTTSDMYRVTMNVIVMLATATIAKSLVLCF